MLSQYEEIVKIFWNWLVDISKSKSKVLSVMSQIKSHLTLLEVA
jgi:hypothetical protein